MKLFIRKIEFCNQCPNAKTDINCTRYSCGRENHKFIGWINGNKHKVPEWCPMPDCPEEEKEFKYVVKLKKETSLTDIEGKTKTYLEGQQFNIVEDNILDLPFFHIIPIYPKPFIPGKKIPLTEHTINRYFEWVTNNPFPAPEYINRKEFEI